MLIEFIKQKNKEKYYMDSSRNGSVRSGSGGNPDEGSIE